MVFDFLGSYQTGFTLCLFCNETRRHKDTGTQSVCILILRQEICISPCICASLLATMGKRKSRRHSVVFDFLGSYQTGFTLYMSCQTRRHKDRGHSVYLNLF